MLGRFLNFNLNLIAAGEPESFSLVYSFLIVEFFTDPGFFSWKLILPGFETTLDDSLPPVSVGPEKIDKFRFCFCCGCSSVLTVTSFLHLTWLIS